MEHCTTQLQFDYALAMQAAYIKDIRNLTMDGQVRSLCMDASKRLRGYKIQLNYWKEVINKLC